MPSLTMVPRGLKPIPVALSGSGHEAPPPQPRWIPGEIQLLTLSSPPTSLWHHTWEKPTFSLLKRGCKLVSDVPVIAAAPVPRDVPLFILIRVG